MNHLSHVVRSLVGVNEVHMDAKFVNNPRFYRLCVYIRTGVMLCICSNGLTVDYGKPASAALQ